MAVCVLVVAEVVVGGPLGARLARASRFVAEHLCKVQWPARLQAEKLYQRGQKNVCVCVLFWL